MNLNFEIQVFNNTRKYTNNKLRILMFTLSLLFLWWLVVIYVCFTHVFCIISSSVVWCKLWVWDFILQYSIFFFLNILLLKSHLLNSMIDRIKWVKYDSNKMWILIIHMLFLILFFPEYYKNSLSSPSFNRITMTVSMVMYIICILPT